MHSLFAQEEKPPFFYSENEEVKAIDTNSLYHFHEYRIDNEYLWLGNNGLANYHLVFDAGIESRFQYSKLLGDLDVSEQKKYNVAVPFTSVKFVQGARLEQYFNLLHTQNFAKNGNFSLAYDKINSDGSYLRQKTNNNKLNASVWYKAPSEKYEFSFFANRIKNTMQQNGGLISDSIFRLDTNAFSGNRKTFQVNLDSAEDVRIANQLALNQTISLFGSLDSLGFGVLHKVDLSTSFTNRQRFYTDGSFPTDFYPNIFIDSSTTSDSIKLNQIKQSVSYNLLARRDGFNLQFQPFFNYYYTDYKQANTHQWFNEVSAGGQLRVKSKTIALNSSLEYFALGYRFTNFDFKNLFRFHFSNEFSWFIKANISQTSPSLDFDRYRGNHHQWDNNFLFMQAYHFSTGTDKNKWGIKALLNYTDIKNPIYFNFNEEVTQSQDFAQVIQAKLSKEFLLKKWRITPEVVYQYRGGVLPFRLPNYLATLKAGYGFNAFRKALAVYTGIKLTYYDDVQLMSYSPALGQFYLGGNNPTVGNYPFLSFFVNARVKDVRLFFALTHLNQGLQQENNYFGAVNYPLEDRAFKVGISWNFKK